MPGLGRHDSVLVTDADARGHLSGSLPHQNCQSLEETLTGGWVVLSVRVTQPGGKSS